jgi:hypothetical protein
MTPAFWILSGAILGIGVGVIITIIWARETLCAYYEDMVRHQQAALTMARKLAQASIENDQLKEQIAGLHAEIDNDPSEAWKKEQA